MMRNSPIDGPISYFLVFVDMAPYSATHHDILFNITFDSITANNRFLFKSEINQQ